MNLSTTYMGLRLSSPLVPSASPLCMELSNLRQMEDCGAGAIVLHSLFEEQIQHESQELDFFLQYGTERFAESLTYYPRIEEYHLGPDEYLSYIARAKETVDIPIIASLNGISAGGWISYAKRMEDAGADGLELNVYYIPTDPRLTGEQVENVYLTVLQAVRMSVTIPVAMKLSPFFSSTANMCARLAQAGASGLVLFNRFYQPDLDIEELEVVPRLQLSTSTESRLPLRWLAILHGRIDASLAGSTGVHTSDDAIKMIMAGADVAMTTSSLLRNGIKHLAEIKAGLEAYMDQKEYESVEQMRGVLSQRNVAEPAAFERANYMRVLTGYGPTATME